MRRIVFVSGIMTLLLIISCATTGKQKESKPAPQTTVSGTVPVLEPVTGYDWEQTKDAVTIKLTPVPFDHKVAYGRSLKEIVEIIGPNDGRKPYKLTETPDHLVIQPDILLLKLHIVNNLSHVLRFHGAVISCNIDGKSLPVDETTQNELLRAVMTPYASLDVSIKGPAAQSIEKAATFTFSIYDVITEVDAANNPTKRTTFEWIFSIRPQQIEESREVRTKKIRLSPEELRTMPQYVVEGTE